MLLFEGVTLRGAGRRWPLVTPEQEVARSSRAGPTPQPPAAHAVKTLAWGLPALMSYRSHNDSHKYPLRYVARARGKYPFYALAPEGVHPLRSADGCQKTIIPKVLRSGGADHRWSDLLPGSVLLVLARCHVCVRYPRLQALWGSAV